jgi:predicted nucleic acid-binding protein
VTPIVDTGPLVALLDRDDHHHAWSIRTLGALRSPAQTCEAVLTETLFLCSRNRVAVEPLLLLLERRLLRVEPVLSDAPESITALLRRWASVPISLADASLVHLHEATPRSFVLTCDSDFHVYRRRSGGPLRVVMPQDR